MDFRRANLLVTRASRYEQSATRLPLHFPSTVKTLTACTLPAACSRARHPTFTLLQRFRERRRASRGTAHIGCLGAHALLRGDGRVRGACARGGSPISRFRRAPVRDANLRRFSSSDRSAREGGVLAAPLIVLAPVRAWGSGAALRVARQRHGPPKKLSHRAPSF